MKFIFLVIHLVFWSHTNFLTANTPPTSMPGEIALGQPSAPITIHAYTALTCSHCSEFHQTLLPRLKKDYVDKGQVRFIFRHFPIDLRSAQATSIVMAVSAIKQLYVIDELFKRQEEWVSAEDPTPIFASISGLSIEKCQKLTTDKELMKPALETRIQAEKQLNIEATPYFVINGRIIDHSPTWDELEKYLKKT
jgi:protein-disulfide isomerase